MPGDSDLDSYSLSDTLAKALSLQIKGVKASFDDNCHDIASGIQRSIRAREEEKVSHAEASHSDEVLQDRARGGERARRGCHTLLSEVHGKTGHTGSAVEMTVWDHSDNG